MGEQASTVRTGSVRADQLQFLRFLAFLFIFTFHTDQWLIVPMQTSHWGNASVSFFIILSGLVTGWSGYGKDVRLTLRDQGQYMLHRIRGFYPLHFLTTMLAVMFSTLPGAVAVMDQEKLRTSLAYLVKNLLLIQSWFPGDKLSYNIPAWFLSTLLFLNLLNLPMIFCLNKVRNSRWKYLLLLTASLGLTGVTVVCCYVTQNVNIDYWHYRFPPIRIGEYLCGMMWGFALRDIRPRLKEKPSVIWIFTALELFALVFWVKSLPHAGNYWRNHIISWLKPNFLLLVVFGCGMGYVSRLFRKRSLVALGDMAFACFLLHFPVARFFTMYTYHCDDSAAGKLFASAFCFLMTLLLARMLQRKQKNG